MRIASVSVVPACITLVVVVPRAAAFASVVTAVGQSLPAMRLGFPFVSVATDVGDEKEALAEVGGADVGRGDDTSENVVSEALKVADNIVHPSRNERRDVLDDDGARTELVDDPRVLAPEPRARAGEAGTLSGVADVLTGEPAANDVHRSKALSSDITNILEASRVRPV
jgi:hypothetical protein